MNSIYVIEQRFLEFFFRNLRQNETTRYSGQFPYISYCGSEINYLRCDDLPFVVTGLDDHNDLIQLNSLKSVNWLVHFSPERLFHNPHTGRLYYDFKDKQIIKNVNTSQIQYSNNEENNLINNHMAAVNKSRHFDKIPCKISLVKSLISINLLKSMRTIERDGKSIYEFDYKSKKYALNSTEQNEISETLKRFSSFKDVPQEAFQ